MILVSIWYRVLAIRRSSSWMPRGFSSYRPNSNETRLPNFKSISENINEKRVILHPKRKQKRKRSDYPWKKFSLYAWIFPFSPPFLGIDRLENVLIQYQYPKVLGIGINLALTVCKLLMPLHYLFILKQHVLASGWHHCSQEGGGSTSSPRRSGRVLPGGSGGWAQEAGGQLCRGWRSSQGRGCECLNLLQLLCSLLFTFFVCVHLRKMRMQTQKDNKVTVKNLLSHNYNVDNFSGPT